MPDTVDFNLHDLFTIRLVNPAQNSVQTVTNQIGVKPSRITAEPDLTIRYVDRFEHQMYYLVMGKAGFFQDKFYVMAGNGRPDARVQFPFKDLGQPCMLVCESGTTEIPLLNLIINLRMLSKGLVPVHASAFVTDGTGVMVNGWPKGGKTTTMLSFLKHGAQFISDDWLFVDAHHQIYGLMQPIMLSDWQLDQLPEYKAKVKRARQWTMRGARWLDHLSQAVPYSAQKKFPPAKAIYKGVKKLYDSQSSVGLSVEKLIGQQPEVPNAHFDVLLLTLSQNSEEIDIVPMAYEVALERLLAALQHEWLPWEEYYTQYIYAFPHSRNPLMDTVHREQRKYLAQVLRNKQIFAVHHPHPVQLDKLYREIHQVLTQVKGLPRNDRVEKVRTV